MKNFHKICHSTCKMEILSDEKLSQVLPLYMQNVIINFKNTYYLEVYLDEALTANNLQTKKCFFVFSTHNFQFLCIFKQEAFTR